VLSRINCGAFVSEEQATPVQSCSPADKGLRVTADASQMCSVSLNDRREFASSSSATMAWNSLAVAPCVMLSQANTKCYSVPDYGGYLVVGLGVIQTSSSSSSISGRRRLLFSGQDNETLSLEDEVEQLGPWNQTANPCRLLALHAAKLTSVSDLEAMKRCMHWKRAGKRALMLLNVTQHMSEHDSFLLSWSDFARVLSSTSASRHLVLAIVARGPPLLLLVAEESGIKSIGSRLLASLSHSALMHAWIHSLDAKPRHSSRRKNVTFAQSPRIWTTMEHRALRLFQGEAFAFLESHLLGVDSARSL
jgi:hypothetical protein